MLFENLIAVGDVVEVGAHTGVVESVGLRVTKIRKFSGELRIVPNGDLTAFGHHAAGWARAIVEVSVRHDQDVAAALRILGEVGRQLQAAHPVEVLETPVAEGILRFEATDAVLRMHARVTAVQKFPLELELRMLVKEAFDRAGLQMALPRMRVAVDPSPHPAIPDPTRKESAA
jgi:small conductance mechanosensitive channel